MNEDGTMARMPQLVKIAEKFGLKMISIASLIAYRLREESLVEKGETVPLPTEWGDFAITPFRQKANGVEHVALTKGTWTADDPVLVRVHSSCATGDIFGSCRCDCGDQLHEAMRMIEREGRGAVVYLQQEGRGIGLCNKIRAYKLQDEGLDTVDANLRLGFREDERDYGVGASIIRELGIQHMRLMTNNPQKRAGLEGYGISIDEIVPIVIAPNEHNLRYLRTKEERMHHTLGLDKNNRAACCEPYDRPDAPPPHSPLDQPSQGAPRLLPPLLRRYGRREVRQPYLRTEGHPIVGEPRTSGDGYFENVVEDPDGNRVEIVDK